jgi:hypothetical protein
LAAAASGVYWAARPYLVTFVLAAAFLWILENFRWRRSPAAEKRLWVLPVLMIVWANSHGGFVVGFLLWGVYWFSELVQWIIRRFIHNSNFTITGSQATTHNAILRLGLIGLLLVLAVCINPSGPVMLAYPLKTVSIGALQDHIQEWQSPDFHETSMQPFIWLLLLTFAAVGVSRRRLALTDFLLAGGFTYMGLMAGRNVALFALAAPAVLTRHAAPVLQAIGRTLGYHGVSSAKPRGAQALLNWILLGVLALAALVKAGMDFPRSVNEGAFKETFPVEAVAFIQAQQPQGRLFNSYNWGAYLLWELPEYPVFVDGRTDLYDDEIIDQWLHVVRGEEGWQSTLDQWEVRLILLEPGTPLVDQLEVQGWELLYGDDVALVYSR